MNTGSAVPPTNSTNPVSGLVSGLGGTTGQATSDVGGTGGHLLSNVANTVGNTLKGAGNKTASTGGPIGSASGGILGGTGSAVGTTGSAAGGLTSKVANAVGGAVNALSGNAPLPQGQSFGQNPLQAPLGSTHHHTGTSSLHTNVHGSHLNQVAREVHVAPTVVVEKVERPTIVKETILPQEKIEVQPVIHREREQLEVHEVVQPLHERDIAATHVRHATLPAEVRAEVRESDTAFQTSYRQATTRHVPEVHTEAVRREVMNRAPIVEEHVHKKIVEEVQPVLYRETVTPVIIEETKPIFEKIVEAPRIVEEVKPMVDLGTRYTNLPTSQMSNLSISGQNYQTGGLPYATGQNYQTGGLPYATGQNFQTGGLPFATGQNYQTSGLPNATGQNFQTGGLPYATGQNLQAGGLPFATGQMNQMGGLPFANQPLQRDTITQETFVEPARATNLHGATNLGTANLPKETIVTQETYVEPARATSHPHTHSKRIV